MSAERCHLIATSYELRATSCVAGETAIFAYSCVCAPATVAATGTRKLNSQLAARSSQLLKNAQLAARSSQLNKAFTLLELLLVLVIIGIIAALVAGKLSGLRDTTAVDQTAQRLRDQARASQLLATQTAQTIRLRIDREQLIAWTTAIDPTLNQNYPDNAPTANREPRTANHLVVALRTSTDDVTLEFDRADGISQRDKTIDIIFYPDRSCDPAGIFTVTSARRAAQVQLSAGGELPQLSASRAIEDMPHSSRLKTGIQVAQ
jgi:type II secretion system protein H